ncbi:hypothetical protein CWI54_26085 [Escherichia coli]|nr:hypothetical protein CWI54_26085 [Escherichia coli]
MERLECADQSFPQQLILLYFFFFYKQKATCEVLRSLGGSELFKKDSSSMRRSPACITPPTAIMTRCRGGISLRIRLG